MNPTPHAARSDDAGLPVVLAARARRASDTRLAADAAGGIIAAGILAAIRPPYWLPLACAAVCFAAFGGWGIADRELAERAASTTAPHPVLRGLRLLTALVGAVAAAMFALLLLGRALGTWIS